MNKFFSNARQKMINLGDFFYYKSLEKELTGSKTVLDVGCGSISPLSKIKKSFYSVGVDIYEPSLKKSQEAKIHDKYKLGNVNKINIFFKSKSFDTVLALDIVEHLNKKEGLGLLEKMEKVAKKKVIVLTPCGFTKQDPYGNNPFQIHKSGWSVSDFEKKGYCVYGMRGFKFIRGEYATIKYKPWILWGIFAILSQFVVYFFPKFAYQLLAVKSLKKK